MSSSQKFSLNSYTLAVFGMLDDVYDMYWSLKEYCDNLADKYKGSDSDWCFFSLTGVGSRERRYIDFVKVKIIREKCQNEFKRQLGLLYKDYYCFFANDDPTDGLYHANFATFWIFDQRRVRHWVKDQNGNTHSRIGFHAHYISFASFIECIEFYTAKAILEKRSSAPKTPIEVIIEEMNRRIDSIAGMKTENAISEQDESNISVPELIVFQSLKAISCNRKKHQVEPLVCQVPLVEHDIQVEIPTHRCKTCGKLFIGKPTLDEYTNKYGILLIAKKKDEGDSGFFDFALESKLHSLGYNVIEGEMSDKERKKLLETLLKRKLITYFEACRDIENAINLFRNRPSFGPAVKKWRADLKYIGDLQVKDEDSK